MQTAEGDQASILNGDKVEQSRWVVPANGSQVVVVQFQSEDMGSFRENLVFEVSVLRSYDYYILRKAPAELTKKQETAAPD